MRGLGREAFKWTAMAFGGLEFFYGLIRGFGFWGSVISAVLLGVILGAVVSLGWDKLHD